MVRAECCLAIRSTSSPNFSGRSGSGSRARRRARAGPRSWRRRTIGRSAKVRSPSERCRGTKGSHVRHEPVRRSIHPTWPAGPFQSSSGTAATQERSGETASSLHGDVFAQAPGGLVACLDPRRRADEEGGQANRWPVGAHPHGLCARHEQPGDEGPPAALDRCLRGHDACWWPYWQVLEDGRRGPLRPRRRGLFPAVGGRGRDRREVLRPHRQGATRHEFRKGDTIYVPQNTIAQHFAADGTPLHLLSVRNRIFRHLGYDNVHYLEDAPEYTERLTSAAATD